MAHAHQQTSHGDGAGAFSRASLATPSSCLPSLNADQDGTRSDYASQLHEHFQIGGGSSSLRRWSALRSLLPRSVGPTHPVERSGAAHGVFLFRMGPVAAVPVQSFAHHSFVLGADALHFVQFLSNHLTCWINKSQQARPFPCQNSTRGGA